LNISSLNLSHSWVAYIKVVANSLRNNPKSSRPASRTWQDKLFATIIVYIVPLSVIAVVIIMIIEIRMGHTTLAAFDGLSILLVVILLLNKQMPLNSKRKLLLVAAVVFSLSSAIFFGNYTIGAIYLFGVSIFIAYQFSNVYAYLSVLGNFMIWTLISACIYYHVRWMPATVTLGPLSVFISNLLFLNLITVIIIRKTLLNFDGSTLKELTFRSRLKTELAAVAELNTKLAESEAQYKTLFFLSPLPKWIYDINTMVILQVNKAAVNAYGYTEDELLNMSIIELTSNVGDDDQQQSLHQDMDQTASASILRQLVKKHGDTCYVDLKWASILYKGKPCRIVIASDITERVNHLEEIEHQNKKIKEIAYMQAHVIRSPLSNIMALSALIRNEFHQFQDDAHFVNLHTSTQELDRVIHEIIEHSKTRLSE
jgi:PAS domain S-box-containing protein